MEPGRRSTRRQMLRSCAAWTAAGVALPAVVSARALASPGPNDTIGIGAIGVGRQGGSLLGGLARHQDARLVAVADVNGPRAREVAGKYNAEAYRDYRNLLERDDIDAVMTATPEQWRGLICIHACQAGKDLYVEKPMSLTVREGRLIVRAVRKHSRVFQTGSQQRSDARNRRGCEFIRSGRVGAIRRVIASNYPSPWKNGLPAQPVPDGLDWDMWCGPAPLVPYHIDLYTPRANP
ncbi:MAG TPA: Gfo/Idh/MocA family oxidoreductase, partial [Armatimonadota bacterium]|nr:Gfo/Idh/MocA family oxidoreductase [Armatimonadota bacterium]